MFMICVLIIIFLSANRGQAAETSRIDVPNRYGMTLTGGKTYDPNGKMCFVQVTGFALIDHERVFPNRAPEPLRVKFEASLGALTRPEKRAMASAHIFALYYINILATDTLRPYVEGGIGGIYMDYRWRGQGTRFNFNPQLGVGTEIKTAAGDSYLVSARLFHVSNAGLNRQNRGLNAVSLSLGRFF